MIKVSLHTAAAAVLAWIDEIYPADIFIGEAEDADMGVKQIVAIRENLRAALKAEEAVVSAPSNEIRLAIKIALLTRRTEYLHLRDSWPEDSQMYAGYQTDVDAVNNALAWLMSFGEEA